MELVAAIGVFLVSWFVARLLATVFDLDMDFIELISFCAGAAMVAYVIAS